MSGLPSLFSLLTKGSCADLRLSSLQPSLLPCKGGLTTLAEACHIILCGVLETLRLHAANCLTESKVLLIDQVPQTNVRSVATERPLANGRTLHLRLLLTSNILHLSSGRANSTLKVGIHVTLNALRKTLGSVALLNLVQNRLRRIGILVHASLTCPLLFIQLRDKSIRRCAVLLKGFRGNVFRTSVHGIVTRHDLGRNFCR